MLLYRLIKNSCRIAWSCKALCVCVYMVFFFVKICVLRVFVICMTSYTHINSAYIARCLSCFYEHIHFVGIQKHMEEAFCFIAFSFLFLLKRFTALFLTLIYWYSFNFICFLWFITLIYSLPLMLRQWSNLSCTDRNTGDPALKVKHLFLVRNRR